MGTSGSLTIDPALLRGQRAMRKPRGTHGSRGWSTGEKGSSGYVPGLTDLFSCYRGLPTSRRGSIPTDPGGSTRASRVILVTVAKGGRTRPSRG